MNALQRIDSVLHGRSHARVLEQEFRRMIKAGHGRPLWLLAEGKCPVYPDAIWEACVHNLAYDQECEGRRTDYLRDLVRLSETEWLLPKVWETLLNSSPEDGDGFDRGVMIELAEAFATDGDLLARETLFRLFEKTAPEQDYAGAEAVIRLVGSSGIGYRKVLSSVEQYGLEDLKDARWWIPLLNEVAQEVMGTDKAQFILSQSLETMPKLRALVDESRKREKEEKQDTSCKGLTFAQFYSKFLARFETEDDQDTLSGMFSFPTRDWIKSASSGEVIEAAKCLLSSKNARIQSHLLNMFMSSRFPLDNEALLQFATSGERITMHKAWTVMLQVPPTATIRRAALDTLHQPDWLNFGVRVLSKYPEPGDLQLIADALNRAADPDVFHSALMDCVDGVRESQDEEGRDLVLKSYEKGPCSICRKTAVQCMMECGWITEEQRLECQYDANSSIRDLVKEGEERN